jgi:hypothetical protein
MCLERQVVSDTGVNYTVMLQSDTGVHDKFEVNLKEEFDHVNTR